MDKELWYKRDIETQNFSRKEKLKLQLWRCIDTLMFQTSLNLLSCWRVFLLKCFGAKIGEKCYISPKARIFIPWHLKVGNCSSIDDYVFIKSTIDVVIDDYVSISNFVHIFPGGHNVRKRNFSSERETVHICNGAFIGADTYIGKGVTIGQMAVIGAKSVVLKDVPENVIAFGFPCQVRDVRIPKEEYQNFRYNYID